MERAAATAFCNIVFGRLFSELSKRYKISKDLKRDTEFIQDELDMLSAYMDDEIKRGRRPDALAPPPAAVARVYSKKMRELTHDIEDCVERFLHRVITCSEGASRIGRVAHGARTFCMRYRFARRMKMYRERLEKELDPIRGLHLHGHGHGSGRSSAAASSADLNPQADADQPAGRPPAALEKSTAMGDLLAMLALEGDVGEQEMSTRVVAVMGFGGSGKTTLAWAAYCHPDVVREFPCRVWVAVRSLERRDAVGILSCVHQSLLPGQQYSRASLGEYLHDKRFLVVVDAIGDIEGGQWHIITSTLTNCRSSRIIVTTTFRPAAKRCSKSSGYVYKMRNLGNEHSIRIALGERCAPELIHGSAMLLEKCDGHPLALVSVADQLNSEDKRTGQFCAKLCRQLGSYLERENDDEPNFRRLRGVLADNYTALSDHSVRTCLLYLCIFPNDHPLRRNMIIRRWLAEGYSRSEHEDSNQNVADGMFDTFSDMNIIQPADTNNNEVANAYKTQRIMHEFLLQKSKSEKFVSTSHGSKLKKIRHISVHDKDDENLTMTLNVDLSCVRSLTVYGKAGKAISNFGKYKLMRVLDLDECSDVNSGHVQGICKLWNLRYLSLGASITRLPSEIAKTKAFADTPFKQTCSQCAASRSHQAALFDTSYWKV